MKVLFKTPQENYALWIEFTSQKGYFNVIQEVQCSRIGVLTKKLRAREFKHIDSRLAAYLFDLEPIKIWGINYFLCQNGNDNDLVSFLIKTYEDWGLNDVSIPTICSWYKHKKKRDFA